MIYFRVNLLGILVGCISFWGCDSASDRNEFGSGARIDSKANSDIKKSGSSTTETKPPTHINDVFSNPFDEAIIIDYDPIDEKNKIREIIENSSLDAQQKSRAIKYVEDANIGELNTVSKFLDQFLDGLITELPSQNKESVSIAVDSSQTITDNLLETDIEKRNQISQDVLKEVLARSNLGIKLPQEQVREITLEKVSISGFFTPEQIGSVVDAVVNQVISDPNYILSNNKPTNEKGNGKVEQVGVENNNNSQTETIGNNENSVSVASNSTLNLLNDNQWSFHTGKSAAYDHSWSGNRMDIDITNNSGGDTDWVVQPSHDLSLIPGKRYRFSVDAASSTNPVNVNIRVEERSDPWAGYAAYSISLASAEKPLKHEFTYSGPQKLIRITLNLGKGFGKIKFQNIQLIQLD